jgi:hypothetical protein
MTQWEYKVKIVDSSEEVKLREFNEIGSEGWELCSVLLVANKKCYYFKRPVQPVEPKQPTIEI